MHVLLLAAFAALLLAGCALKAPPTADELRTQALPHTSAPERWTAEPTSPAPPADGWLTAFDDPTLNALVSEALAYNTDLQVAAARVEQAAGYVRVAGATLYPIVNLLARGGGKLGGDESGLQGVLLSASWELDVWGRVRYVRAAAVAQYQASESDYRYARASIAALVAKSWFLASEARQQRDLAARVVSDSERLLSLAGDRQRIGRGDAFDVSIASASVETFRDTLRQADLAYGQAVRALELLLGRYPAAALDAPARFATMPSQVAAGIPSELLERRPDVIAAERRVAAAFNRIGEAKTAMLPRIALTAGVSSVSSELFVLKNHDNPVVSLGANLVAPLFQGGALVGTVDVRTAEQQQAVAEYARVAQRAFNEVESALASEAAARDRVPILSRASAENSRAVDLAGIRLRVGSGDLRGVLQQQLALYGTQSALLRAQGEQLVQRVNLYLALGGDFGTPGTSPSRDEPMPAPVAATRSGTTSP